MANLMFEKESALCVLQPTATTIQLHKLLSTTVTVPLLTFTFLSPH